MKWYCSSLHFTLSLNHLGRCIADRCRGSSLISEALKFEPNTIHLWATVHEWFWLPRGWYLVAVWFLWMRRVAIRYGTDCGLQRDTSWASWWIEDVGVHANNGLCKVSPPLSYVKLFTGTLLWPKRKDSQPKPTQNQHISPKYSQPVQHGISFLPLDSTHRSRPSSFNVSERGTKCHCAFEAVF